MDEILKFGLMTAEIGSLATFALLGLLIFLFVWGFGYLSSRLSNQEEDTPETDKAGEIDVKIIAAITACISCFYFTKSISETKDMQPEFIVKSIKRRK